MKKLIGLFLALALLLCALPAGADGLKELEQRTNKDGFVYVVQADGTAKIVGFTGGQKKLSIPAELDGYEVTVIGESSFLQNGTIQSVSFPDSVTRIESHAFASCRVLADAPLPKKLVYLGDYAFSGCHELKNVGTLPDSLSEIGENPFVECLKLKSAKISKKHPYLEIRDGVLFSKADSRLVWYPYPTKSRAYKVPDGTKIIGSMSCMYCSISKVTIPESVVEIWANAFGYCHGLREINIPSGVSDVRAIAPANAGLTTIRVSPDNPWFESIDGVLFRRDERELMLYPSGRNESSYTVPEGTVKIAEEAFREAHFRSVVFPESLKTISDIAFAMSWLEQVTFPESVEWVGNFTFNNCFNLREVTIPRSTRIGEGVFCGAKQLGTIHIDADHPALALEGNCLYTRDTGELLWYSPLAEEESVALPSGIRILGRGAIQNENIRELILPEDVTEIRENSLNGCSRMTRIVLPASLSSVAEAALPRTTYWTENPEPVIYVVPAGSYAEAYCKLYELSFEVVPQQAE